MLLQSLGLSRHNRGTPRHTVRDATFSKLLTATLLGSSALTGFIAPVMAEEPWIMVERVWWEDANAARGQGVTTDGTNWYFSGTHSLEIADEDYNTILLDGNAILSQVGLANGYTDVELNHIGDIDYADGYLYISLDSTLRDPVTGERYSNPVIAVYDAATLTWTGQAYTLNPPDGISDIASWVAVDADAGLAYGMAYDNATQIAVYNLSDFSFVGYTQLSDTIDQAQGGKILDGWMYFATDNDEKLLMRANLTTGEVEVIGELYLDGADQEVEGLSFQWTEDGWTLNVLDREESIPGADDMSVAYYTYLRPYGNVLSGEIHADIAGALLSDSRGLRDATNGRLRSGLETGTANDGAVFWGEALGSTSNTEGVGDAADFNRHSAGVIGGVEGTLGNWLVGLSAGYARSSYNVDDRDSTASIDTYQLGVYGGTRLGDLGLHLGAGFAAHDISVERSVVFPAFNDQLSAEYGARTLQAYGELDYRIDTEVAVFSPFAGLALVYQDTEAFAETGGDTAALSSDKTSAHNMFTTVGVRAEMPLSFGETSGKLHGQIGWQHALEDVETSMNLSFNTGASFDSQGVPIAKDALALEVGFDLALSDQASLLAGYSAQLASGASNQDIKLGLGVKF